MSELGRLLVADVPPGTAKRLGGGPGAVCVVRIGDDFYALADRCSHAAVSLSEGDVDTDELTIECWKHGSAFSLATGEPQSLPAVKPVAVYKATVEGDHVVIHSS